MTTTSDVAVREPSGALAIQAGQVAWDPMQLAALAQLGIADASDGDKQVFLHVSQRTGLDPFARQIYMIGRNEKKNEKRGGQWVEIWTTKWTIQTGIEGWRVIRDRAERRYGVRGIKSRFTYYGPDGSAHPVWVGRQPPVAIEMTYTVVERDGREVPYTSILRFDEYKQTKTIKQDGQDVQVAVAQWATKPVHMLEKCTEADAYRCAFPQDYSGVVLDDAMPLPDPDAPPAPQRQRVTGDDLRNRAQQRQQAEPVDAVIVDDVPWPADAEPSRPTTSGASSSAGDPGSASPTATGPQSPSSPHGSANGADVNPRDEVLASLDRLGVAGAPAIAAILTRLSGQPIASVDGLNRKQAQWFTAKLADIETRDELEAAAVAAEVQREDGTANGGE